MVVPDENVLRVGIAANSPPLAYKSGETIVGLEADLAQALAAYLGKTLHFVELAWVDQIPALIDKRTDIIMAGMTITEGRKLRIAFSKPYFRSGQMALVQKEEKSLYAVPFFAIQGLSITRKIGVVKGTTGEAFTRKNFGSAKDIIPFDTAGKAVDELKQGRIDIFIHDAPMILVLASDNEAEGITPLPSIMTEEYLAWGIRKEDSELVNAANQFIEMLKKEGKLMPLVNKWIPLAK